MSLHRFSNFAIPENFHNRFLRNYESYKAESSYQYGNCLDVLCIQEWGSSVHNFGDVPWLVFRKLKCIWLNKFYVCGPTTIEFIPHFGALKRW